MMNKMEHFLTHFQTRLQTHWHKPSLTDYYGGADYTLGQVATEMRKIEMLMDLMDVKQGDKVALCGKNCGFNIIPTSSPCLLNFSKDFLINSEAYA